MALPLASGATIAAMSLPFPDLDAHNWVAVRTFAFLAGAMAAAISVVYYDVYVLGRLGDTASFRMDHAFSAPAAGFLLGVVVAAQVLIRSAFSFLAVLAVVYGFGLRESNARARPWSFAAGVFTALGDRVITGPFEEWASSHALFSSNCHGDLYFSKSAWHLSLPLDWVWMLGFPALCAVLLLRRSPLGGGAELNSPAST
jgi:hypothetical protein